MGGVAEWRKICAKKMKLHFEKNNLRVGVVFVSRLLLSPWQRSPLNMRLVGPESATGADTWQLWGPNVTPEG